MILFQWIHISTSAYLESFRFIRKHKKRHWFALSALLALLIAFAAIYGIQVLHEYGLSAIRDRWGLNVANNSDSWWAVLVNGARLFLDQTVSMVLWLGLFVLKIKLIKYVVLIVSGPLMAHVSERTEAILSGEERPWDMAQWLQDLWRGVRSSLLLFCCEMGVAGVVFLVSIATALLFPPLAWLLGPFFAFVGFIVGSWFYGASMFDLVWERRGLGGFSGLKKSWQVRQLVVAAGIPFQVWMMIPVLSWYIAPMVAPISCTVATVLIWHRNSQHGLYKGMAEE